MKILELTLIILAAAALAIWRAVATFKITFTKKNL
jgi:hypothetical protein